MESILEKEMAEAQKTKEQQKKMEKIICNTKAYFVRYKW
jgi:hypothetical protein